MSDEYDGSEADWIVDFDDVEIDSDYEHEIPDDGYTPWSSDMEEQ